jgi:hypothetical protein
MIVATEPRTLVAEPFDLSRAAIKRIAEDAGAEDAACARRILLAYWHSPERKARDRALLNDGRQLAKSVY